MSNFIDYADLRNQSSQQGLILDIETSENNPVAYSEFPKIKYWWYYAWLIIIVVIKISIISTDQSCINKTQALSQEKKLKFPD